MNYKSDYDSPLGKILITSDDTGITGLWFYGQKYFAAGLKGALIEEENTHITEAKLWLDKYFEGMDPGPVPSLNMKGTDFQMEVWEILKTIPYGDSVTYGYIAEKIAQNRGIRSMSAQAVGGAVGHNPISIIVPCHRVVGSDGKMTGYAGGIDKKLALLRYENLDNK